MNWDRIERAFSNAPFFYKFLPFALLLMFTGSRDCFLFGVFYSLMALWYIFFFEDWLEEPKQ